MKTFKELRVELEEWNSGTGELGVIQYHDDGSYDVKVSSGGRGGLFGGGYPRPKPNSKTGYKAVNKDDIPGAKVVDDTKTGYKAVDDTKTGYKAAKVSNDIPGAKAVSDHDSLKAYAASKLKKMSEEYFVEDLDSDDLYSVLVNEDIDDYTRCIVALELFERGDIELYEDEYEDLMNLLEIAADKPRYRVPAEVRDVKPDPRTYSAVQDVKKASDNKDLGMKGRVSKGSVPKTSSMADRISAKDRVPAKSSRVGKIGKGVGTVGGVLGGAGEYESGRQVRGNTTFSDRLSSIGKSAARGAAAGASTGILGGGKGALIGGVVGAGSGAVSNVLGQLVRQKTDKDEQSINKAVRRTPTQKIERIKRRADELKSKFKSSPDLDKPRETSPMATVSPVKSGNIPLAEPITKSSDAARTAPTRKALPSSGVKRLSTATGKPSKNIPVVDTAVKPISKGSKSSAPVPVIKKVSPKELTKPKIAAKVDKAGRATPDVAQQTGVTARMGQSGRTQTFSNIARGASSDKSSSGMFQKAGTEYSAQKNLPPHGSAARDVELAKRGFKKF